MAKSSRSSSKQKYGLIAAVRAQKSLFDPKHVNFKSNNSVWNQVATQCGIKRGQMAKLMWKNIREAYSAYRKNPNKNSNKTYSMFFKHMTFIDPYLTKPSEENNSSVPESNLNTKNEVETIEDIDDVECLNINEPTTNREFTTIQYWSETKDDSENVTELETNPIVQPTGEACSEVNSESNVGSYEDIILPDAMNDGSIDNSLKMFFDAMLASTTRLPKVLQRTIKRKIFSAVLEAEEEAEKQESGSSRANCILVNDDL